MSKTGAGEQPVPAATALGTVKTIAWAFFGVRKRHDHEREARVNPLVSQRVSSACSCWWPR